MRGFVSALFGMAVVILVAYYTISSTSSDFYVYWNFLGFLIVVGGTVSASSISFGMSFIFKFFQIVRLTFKTPDDNSVKVVSDLVKITNQIHRQGHYGMPAELPVHPFIKDGLRLLQNGIERRMLEQILIHTVSERQRSLATDAAILKAIAKYPPAFGMIGTVLGLVALLNGLAGESSQQYIGPNLAIALVTTLYGLLMANNIILPMTDKLIMDQNVDLHQRRIIVHAILLLYDKEDPVVIHEVLNSYLMPSQRIADHSAANPLRKGVA